MKYLFVFLLIGGCAFGNGQICGPQTPIAYCDKEAYEKLAHPKPYGARWIKENGTDEQRLLDIKECGGGIGLHVGFTDSQEEAERREGETSLFPARARLYRAWVQCMKDRGYRYVYQ
jgi:hypothetical protein